MIPLVSLFLENRPPIETMPLEIRYAGDYNHIRNCRFFEGKAEDIRFVDSDSLFDGSYIPNFGKEKIVKNEIEFTLIETYRVNGEKVDVYNDWGIAQMISPRKNYSGFKNIWSDFLSPLVKGQNYVIVGQDFDGSKTAKSLFRVTDIELASSAGSSKRKLVSGYRCRKAISKPIADFQSYMENVYKIAIQRKADSAEAERILKEFDFISFQRYGKAAVKDYAFIRYQLPIWLSNLADLSNDKSKRLDFRAAAFSYGGFSYLPPLFNEVMSNPVSKANIDANPKYFSLHRYLESSVGLKIKHSDLFFKLQQINPYLPESDKPRYWNYIRNAKTDFQKLFLINNFPYACDRDEDVEPWAEFVLKEDNPLILKRFEISSVPRQRKDLFFLQGHSLKETVRQNFPRVAKRLGITKSFDE